MAVSVSDPSESVRLMTYSHDGFGLGHLRRVRDISRCLVRDHPKSNVLMLIGCPSGSVFPLPAGIDYIKIPSIVKVDTEVWQLRNLSIDDNQAKALRASVIHKAADIFEPHLFLVDHIPAGVWGELLPTLKMLKQRGAAVVLGIRDILDSPEVTRTVWKQKRFYELIAQYYDEVFIYGCEDVFDTASQYGLAEEVGEKVRYCGYVCSDEPFAPRARIRRELQIKKDRWVLVTAGGGYDAFPLMQACLEAFRLYGPTMPFDAMLITGPLMVPEQQDRLRNLATSLGVTVRQSVEDSLSYMNAADLVVTMAGYNSLSEILRLRKKAVVIPRLGPSAEQTTRAKIFAERGLIDVIHPSDLTPQVLSERILSGLERKDFPSPDPSIELCGGRKAAERLIQLWRQKVGAGDELQSRISGLTYASGAQGLSNKRSGTDLPPRMGNA